MMNKEQQPQMNIDFSKTEPNVCNECENDTFSQVFKIRKLSALLSPTGKPTLIPFPVFTCSKCGYINPEFLPKEE